MGLFVTVQAIYVIASAAASNTWSVQLGATYVVVKNSKTINWEAAQSACKATGGDLATLPSYKAIDAIASGYASKKGDYFWIGAKNSAKNSTTWTWLSGE